MNKTILSLCAISIFLIVSCKPPTVLYYVVGNVRADKSGGYESIEQVILRYQKGDTLQYMVDYYANLEQLKEKEQKLKTKLEFYPKKAMLHSV